MLANGPKKRPRRQVDQLLAKTKNKCRTRCVMAMKIINPTIRYVQIVIVLCSNYRWSSVRTINSIMFAFEWPTSSKIWLVFVTGPSSFCGRRCIDALAARAIGSNNNSRLLHIAFCAFDVLTREWSCNGVNGSTRANKSFHVATYLPTFASKRHSSNSQAKITESVNLALPMEVVHGVVIYNILNIKQSWAVEYKAMMLGQKQL